MPGTSNPFAPIAPQVGNIAGEVQATPPSGGLRRAVRRVFAPDGLMTKALASGGREFEARPEQLQMAEAVAGAAEDKTHLLVEAGTGTGKSYAYLVPFILWALENKKKVLIATHTKALQQQLVERDLPFLREMFVRRMGLEFRYALCLGTGNYVCPRRLAKAESVGLFASQDENRQLRDLRTFAAQSPTGRNLDLTFEPLPQLWAQVNRESDLCLGRSCENYESSFFYRARHEQEKAHVLVANHHLLFAHLAAGGNEAGGVLPAFDALVIDEGHKAEDVASAYLGMEASNLALARLIEILHHPRTGRTVISGSDLPEIATLEQRLTAAAQEVRAAAGTFFDNLIAVLQLEVTRSQAVRLRHPQVIHNILDEPLGRLDDVLVDCRRGAEMLDDDALTKELEGFSNRCAAMRSTVTELLNHARTGYVYWLSVQPRQAEFGRGTRVPRLALCGAPIDVAEAMQETLFGPICPVVMASATLTTGGSFHFVRERLGLTKEQCATEVRTLALGSPFDYRQNALLYLVRDLPDPSQATEFERAAIHRATEVLQRTHGRAFVLCTSFRMVDATAKMLRDCLRSSIKVLKQGEMPRGRLLDTFREDINSVLVGTSSFWQGVDVPGESLTCVIIMKLPFAVPDEPLVQARVEALRQRGRDAFNEYQVPQAVMMFRQGFGRLIRTRTDRGIVAVLDPRTVTKRYGQVFLESLPECAVTDDLEVVARFAPPGGAKP